MDILPYFLLHTLTTVAVFSDIKCSCDISIFLYVEKSKSWQVIRCVPAIDRMYVVFKKKKKGKCCFWDHEWCNGLSYHLICWVGTTAFFCPVSCRLQSHDHSFTTKAFSGQCAWVKQITSQYFTLHTGLHALQSLYSLNPFKNISWKLLIMYCLF